MEEPINQTTNQSIFFLMLQKYVRDTFIVNYTITLIKIFVQNTKEVFVKAFVFSLLVMIEKNPRKLPVITKNFVRLFWQTYRKLLTVSVTISSAKLSAYGFDRNALKLIYDYLVIDHKKLKQVFRSVPI